MADQTPTIEPEYQTMTAVGKVMVSDNSTAILLGLLGFSASKLWNTAVWHTREVWQTTGKIPTYQDLDIAIKQECPVWYRRLHSQSAQAVLEELWQSYKSWFALRKKGYKKANPPDFRRKTTLSAVTFKQSAVTWNPRTSTVRFSIPRDVYDKKSIFLKVKFQEWMRISEDSIQIGRLIYDKGEWYVHLVYKILLPVLKENGGETMSLDLGMKHLAATACTDMSTKLWLGGELAALERYFEKRSQKPQKADRVSHLL